MKAQATQLNQEVDVSLVTNDAPIRAIGIAVLIGTVGILGTWSYLAPISSSAAAPGFVTVKSHRGECDYLSPL